MNHTDTRCRSRVCCFGARCNLETQNNDKASLDPSLAAQAESGNRWHAGKAGPENQTRPLLTDNRVQDTRGRYFRTTHQALKKSIPSYSQYPEKASQKAQNETGRAPDDGALTDWPPATPQMNPRAAPDDGETVYVKISSVDSYRTKSKGAF